MKVDGEDQSGAKILYRRRAKRAFNIEIRAWKEEKILSRRAGQSGAEYRYQYITIIVKRSKHIRAKKSVGNRR